jgi:hypothetical protein
MVETQGMKSMIAKILTDIKAEAYRRAGFEMHWAWLSR